MRAVRVATALAAALAPLVGAAGAGAKMPYHSIRVHPRAVPPGEEVRVVVRFFRDQDRSRPAPGVAPSWLFLIPLDAAGRPVVADKVRLRFEAVTRSRYLARVVPPHPGTWWVVGWPSNGVDPPSAPEARGFTGTVALRVLGTEGRARGAPGRLAGELAVAGSAVLVAVGAALVLRRRAAVAAR
ncbi:MAG TPA: hypothetical protein VNO17_01695 [Actinomycetota bacterium]|nr:hypothetical protein [Actinomycetota bacterium]